MASPAKPSTSGAAKAELQMLEQHLASVWAEIRLCRQMGGDPSRPNFAGVSLISERDDIARRLKVLRNG